MPWMVGVLLFIGRRSTLSAVFVGGSINIRCGVGGVVPEIPLAPLDRIMHRAGAERVSEDAVELLRDIVESVAYEIAQKSVDAAKHAGRKTVTADDVKLVVRLLKCLPLQVS